MRGGPISVCWCRDAVWVVVLTVASGLVVAIVVVDSERCGIGVGVRAGGACQSSCGRVVDAFEAVHVELHFGTALRSHLQVLSAERVLVAASDRDGCSRGRGRVVA
jgi:hypothetical protein